MDFNEAKDAALSHVGVCVVDDLSKAITRLDKVLHYLVIVFLSEQIGFKLTLLTLTELDHSLDPSCDDFKDGLESGRLFYLE